MKMCSGLLHTLFQIFIFCTKIQLWYPEKIDDFFWVKNSWKCCGLGLFSCWQLWFHEKNCQKNLAEKLVKMLGGCQNWIFGQKIDFRIVCCRVFQQVLDERFHWKSQRQIKMKKIFVKKKINKKKSSN